MRMITVNSDPIAWAKDMTISTLLDVCKYRYPMIMVKVNGQLVKRKEFETYVVPDESDVRVIHMMTGG